MTDAGRAATGNSFFTLPPFLLTDGERTIPKRDKRCKTPREGMMSRAMMVALVALFFSLTGWATAAKMAMAPANTVNTQSIVNGSIRLADLHPSAVRLLKGQQGDPGPQGAAGLTGPPGPAGAAGGFDPAKVTYVGSNSAPVAQYTIGTAFATCPPGTRVIGGSVSPGAGSIAISAPTSDRSSWAGSVGNGSNLPTITFGVTAICASP